MKNASQARFERNASQMELASVKDDDQDDIEEDGNNAGDAET